MWKRKTRKTINALPELIWAHHIMAWTLLEFHTLINLGSIPQSLRNFLSTHQIFVVTNVLVPVCSSLSRNFGKKTKPSYSPLNKKLMRQMTHVVVGQKIIDLILKWKVKECKSWLGEKRLKQLDVRIVCFFTLLICKKMNVDTMCMYPWELSFLCQEFNNCTGLLFERKCLLISIPDL